MIRNLALSALVTLGLAGAALADIREVGQNELRRLIRSGQAFGLSDILEAFAKGGEGEFVDARAFDADGLVYALMFMRSDGKVTTLVVDAVSGRVLPPRSDRADIVLAVAKQTPGAGNRSTAVSRNKGRDRNTNRDRDKDRKKDKKKRPDKDDD